MTKSERDKLAARYIEISDELMAIARDRGANCTPTFAELNLRAEHDEIEYRLGVYSRERRDATS